MTRSSLQHWDSGNHSPPQEVEPDNVLALSCYPGLKEAQQEPPKRTHVMWLRSEVLVLDVKAFEVSGS